MSENKKKVSVIVPAYNVENYIKRCLESLVVQTYENIEIIAVDDGSTDKTPDIINECAGLDSRIKAMTKDNGGVSSARNLALSEVTGEYLCFLDADDEMESTAIETMVEAMEAKEADWLNCQYSRWDEEGRQLENYNFINGDFSFETDDERVNFAVTQLLNYYVGFEVWNKLFRTEIVKKNGLIFSEKCKIGEDLAFNLIYLMHTNKLTCIDNRCVKYTVRQSSAMGSLNSLPRKISENIILLETVFDHAKECGLTTVVERFPLIFVKVMDNSYISNTAAEVAAAYKDVKNVSFAILGYKELDREKKEILNLYSEDVAEIKYRYHIYVRQKIGASKIGDGLKLFIYNSYRRLRCREVLDSWIMPY